MPLAAGVRLGPYEIVTLIGTGGMGEVYRARDPRLGRDVAVKVLPSAFAADTDRLRRFEQEAQAAAALNHPNILAVHDIGTHASTDSGQMSLYIVSELLEGNTLGDLLRAGAMPARRAIQYVVPIAAGLAAAHDKGIVHRDLKPENVFITADGRVKFWTSGWPS
jgi:serine/threonine protein kinase